MLQLRKETENGIWRYIDTVRFQSGFFITQAYAKDDGVLFQIVEEGGSQRILYSISEIEVYDDTDAGTTETFTTFTDLYARLKELRSPLFDYSSDVGVPLWAMNGDGEVYNLNPNGNVRIPNFLYVGSFIQFNAGQGWTDGGGNTKLTYENMPERFQTTKLFRGTIYFTGKTANDFAQMQDVTDAISGNELFELDGSEEFVQPKDGKGILVPGSSTNYVNITDGTIIASDATHYSRLGRDGSVEFLSGSHVARLRADNLTAMRVNQTPDASGVFAISVNSNAANNAGNITLTADNIPAGTTNKYASSITGTTNRITVSGLAVDISGTFEALLAKIANRIDQNNSATTSAQLATVISDEVGTGFLVFNNNTPLTGTTTAVALTIASANAFNITGGSSNNLLLGTGQPVSGQNFIGGRPIGSDPGTYAAMTSSTTYNQAVWTLADTVVTASYDFLSIPANSNLTTTIAITGAVVGNRVEVAANPPTLGVIYTAEITSAGTATLVANNVTVSAINPVNTSFKLYCKKY